MKQLSRKYSWGGLGEPWLLVAARQLDVLLHAPQPPRQPRAIGLHVGHPQPGESLEDPVGDHREHGHLGLVGVADGVPLGEGLEPVGPGRRPVVAHEIMGGEGAVQILEQLVHGVVVGVAQHPAVEHVGPGEKAPGAQVVIGVLDLLHRPVHIVHHHRPSGDHPPAGGLPQSPGPSGCKPGTWRPGVRGPCRQTTGRSRGRRSP